MSHLEREREGGGVEGEIEMFNMFQVHVQSNSGRWCPVESTSHFDPKFLRWLLPMTATEAEFFRARAQKGSEAWVIRGPEDG